MTDVNKVRAKSYEKYYFVIAGDRMVFVPDGVGDYELPAFRINEETARMLEHAAETVREALSSGSK